MYPVLWFQCLAYVFLVLVWIHHIIFEVCIVIVAEKNFTLGEAPYFRIFKDVTGVDGEQGLTYLISFETGVVCAFTLELLAKLSVFLYEYYESEI
jgi:hypothetical protein